MADLPDMSHLTPEERRIIERVMMRQKQEEQRENEIMSRKQAEVQVLEETIRARSEQHKKSGIELDATCQICSKTKFADGVGHICNYCNIRCCARCGGKVTLRSNKVIWVCIVCRKKQEIFLKTGQWMTKSSLNAADTAMLRRMQEDMQGAGPPGHPELTQDKRPKLERAHSAAEKENLPLLQRSGSTLRRQYSQQDQGSGRRMSTSDSGVEMSVSPHSRTLPTPHAVVGSYPQTPRHPAAYPEDDPSLYRGELDSLMQQHAQTYQRQRPMYQDSDIPMPYGPGVDTMARTMHSSQQHPMHPGHPSQPGGPPGGSVQATLHQQRSFSSSEEERSTPECASDEPDESEKGEKPASIIVATPRSPRDIAGDRINRQTMLNEKMKKFLAQPLSWQGSSDGQKIIGHMILRKTSGSSNSSSILGLKVVGGKLLENGSRGALIEKVKKGSTADVEGQLRPGDEVIEWNGRSLQGKSFQEVNDIIMKSREEPQVQLIVSRNLSGTSTTAMMTGMPTTIPPAIRSPRRISAQTQWRQKHEPMAMPPQHHHKGLKKSILWELYDARRDKPSVLVTSPGSPDLHAQGRGRQRRRYPVPSNEHVGGTMQVQVGFEHLTGALYVTVICAIGLTSRSNGDLRSPYAKIHLLPDKCDTGKKRTKVLKGTNDPQWHETVVFDNISRSNLRHRGLEISVWDHMNSTNEFKDFLGEIIIELATSALNEKPQWYYLGRHDEHLQQYPSFYPEDDMITPTAVITAGDCHLSPPSTTSRLSDSDTSECDITDCDLTREQRRTADGASLSSRGSSSRFHNMPSNYKRHYSSPPPEREMCMDNEHKSRRDMSPQGRKRAALMITRDQPISIAGYQPYRKQDEPLRSMMGHRSHSAAPMDSPNVRYRGRSQSPTGHRSLSPPEHRSIPYPLGYVPTRFGSRSATATPTGSPKKRQLPQIPANLHAALKERVAQDLEERARIMKHRNRQVHTTYRSTGMGGWERHYSGRSDSDLPSIGHDPMSMSHSHAHRMHRTRRGHMSPDKDVLGDLGDSDMESNASVTSSVFSTQSERPRGSRTLIPTVKNVLIPGVISPMPPPPRRNRRRHRLRVPCSECHCPTSANNNNNNIFINPTKSRSYPTVKHNPPPHPLVRSKSAVVRSLYRKMRTPFTRSQTVDENLLRYYSPETSEYTVSEGYMLKPEVLTGNSKKRIPEIYVEDCLQVNFNDRLLDKFRNGSGASSASTSYAVPYSCELAAKKPTSASLARLRSGWKEPFENSIVSRSRPLADSSMGLTDYDLRNLETRPTPRRSMLFAKARSFDYNVVHDPCRGGFPTGSMRDTGFLARRAKSFEYDTISSNIFSDDSLRTARRKLKRNLSISDSKYGDKIPALRDCSKSYYDSNGDNTLRKTLAAKSLLKYDNFGAQENIKNFYGYDSELSAGETEIYVSNFDKQSVESVIEAKNFRSLDSRVPSLGLDGILMSDNTRCGLAGTILGREDIGKRKYMETGYRSPEKRTKSLENDIYGPLEGNDHIYCSIDEIILPEDPCECRLLRDTARRSRANYESPLHRATITCLEEMDDYVTRRHVRPRRRAKSTDSYLEDEYERYENWDAADCETEYPEAEALGDSRIAGLEMDDYYDDRGIRNLKKQRNAQLEDITIRSGVHDEYGAYHDNESFADDSLSYRDHSDINREYNDEFSPRRRRRRRDNVECVSNGDYENLRVHEDLIRTRKNSLTVPSFSQSKKMMIGRAESTPILIHDEDYGVSEERTARRLSRRRRNSSCPESREIVLADSSTRREDERSGFFVDSDEDFGSMETVIGPNYGDRTSDTRNVASRSRYPDDKISASETTDVDYRTGRNERTGSFSGTIGYRPDEDPAADYDYRRRKSSCPECREIDRLDGKSGILTSRREEDDSLRHEDAEARYKYRRRRNSSCPEARDIELFDEENRQRRMSRHDDRQDHQQQQQQQQQQGSKRNVAISDTLEYYEYSMESESQCSENCGFGPYDPLRPRNRAAPRPGNANSNIFDSQKTATSDTAKNPRATDDHQHHDIPKRRNHAQQQRADDHDCNIHDTTSSSASKNHDYANDDNPTNRHHRSQRKKYDDDDDERGTTKNYDGNERRSTSMPESSEYASQGSSYETTSRHPVPGSGHNGHAKRGQFTRSLSNADGPPDEKADGSLSDTAVGLHVEDPSRRGRKSSPGSKSGSGSSSGGGSASQYQAGLGKKSNSTSQLSATGGTCVGEEGRKRRLGFGKKGKSSFTVHRSEEVLPDDTSGGRSGRQPSSASSDGEGSGDGDSWSPSRRVPGEGGQLSEFIDGLGSGQLVGRQVLGSSSLGDVQLGIKHTKGYLEVEVIRARGLQAKQGTKVLPAPYIKVYLVNGKKCIEKAKTTPARQTLDPFYQNILIFKQNYQGCILQVTVWGDYGRLEGRKVFMGVAQIMLDNLNLSEMTVEWYKLFGTTSL